MPSQTTASKEKKVSPEADDMVRVQVLRPIGIPATDEDIQKLKQRAERKGIAFNPNGLTTMIHPNKPYYDKQKRDFVPGEPVFIMLERSIARKLNEAGAVRVII